MKVKKYCECPAVVQQREYPADVQKQFCLFYFSTAVVFVYFFPFYFLQI